MRLGISTASFFGKAPTETAFDLLRQLMCTTTEVFLNTFSEYEKPFVDSLQLRKGTINVHSVHALATQFEPELYSPNLRVRNDAEIIFRKVCYAGHILGAKYYTFHGPLRLKNSGLAFDFVKLGERTNQLIDIAASYGLRLSYENVHYAYFSEPNYFEQLSKECPKLMATLDVKQALQGQEDVFGFLNVMGNKLSTVHVCDFYKNSTCLPGTGKFNFEKLFKQLLKVGYQGPIILELYSKDYNEMMAIKQSYDYLNQLLIKVRNGKA